MATNPIHGAHAIAEVAFALEFASEFDERAVQAVLLLQEPLREELPRMEALNAITFQFQPQQGASISPAARPTGAIFQSVKQNGSPAWILRAEGKRIVVNCLDYLRWADVWARAQRYFSMATQAVMIGENPIAQVALQYVDHFVRDGQQGYSATEVFRADSVYLTRKALDSGALWHVHQGWFEQPQEFGERCLNVVNIATNDAGGVHTTSIDHNQLFQLRERPIAQLGGLIERLDRMMQYMHQRNKQVLAGLVAREMSQRIGLEVERL